MTRSVPFALTAFLLIAGGCATRGNVDLLESQLRRQEDQLYAARAQLDQTEADLRIARQEVQTLRVQLAEKGEKPLLPEQAQSLYRVSGVRVNELFSGGLDRDGLPGDEVLSVMISPHDEHGETVKLPGQVELELLDLSAPESSQELGLWTFRPDEVAERWQSGLTSGFQFRVPLRQLPRSEKVVLHVRFATVDGRRFGTSADLRVTPPDTQLADSHDRDFAIPDSVPAPSKTTKPARPPEPKFSIEPTRPPEDGKPPIEPIEKTASEPQPQDFFPADIQLKPPEAETANTLGVDDIPEDFLPETQNAPPSPLPIDEPVERAWKARKPATPETNSPKNAATFQKRLEPIPVKLETAAGEKPIDSDEFLLPKAVSADPGDQKPF